MNCNELEGVLQPFLDGEIEGAELTRIEVHLASCEPCATRADSETRWREGLRDALRRAIPTEQRAASEALRARVRHQVESTYRRQRRPLVLGSIAAAAAVVTLVSGSVWMQRQRVRTLRLEEVALRHARGLPFEVSNVAPEQVEAWFVGKLDHRVTVPRLPKAHLVGARLSNVQDKQAAHLTYVPDGTAMPRRVGVFVYDDAEGAPTTASMDAPEIAHRRGFNTATWREGELVYQLVTDLDEKDILQMLQRNPAIAAGAATPGVVPVQSVSLPADEAPYSVAPLSVMPAVITPAGHSVDAH